MIRRLIIALIALLIAAVGGVMTFMYASGADARAMARMEPVQVLVLAEPVAEGTAVEDIARSLTVAELPAAAVVPGGITDLSEIAGLVAVTDLQPGEQLLASRFIAPEAVSGEVEVPTNMHQLSVQLESQRVIGGELRPGDTVGVFVSANLDTSTEGQESTSESVTRLVLHQVLVTAVHGGVTITTDDNGNQVEQAAEGSIMVTLALSPADAETVVFAQEFATIWLSLEGAEVPADGTRIVNAEEIFG